MKSLMMKKKLKVVLFITFLIPGFLCAKAQTDTIKTLKTYRVAIFAPLYLDSVFTGTTYRYGKKFPKFAAAGLDFVQGAQIALDSLPMLYGNIDATIYDSKSYVQDIPSLIRNKALDSLDLIIGSVKEDEFSQLAGFAQQKNIPFISATHPNDGGTTNNPFLVIVNSTLKAHCEAIYSHLLQQHSTDKIFLVRKSGAQENTVAAYFKQINEPDGKPLLKIETIFADSNFNLLRSKLDSNRKSVFIGGSLNETFANSLATFSQSISKKYPVLLIGMPNWDGFTSFTKNKKLKDFPIYYTTPFFNNKWDNFSKQIKEIYQTRYKGVPSDLTYKGFETVYLFTKLLSMHPDDFTSNLNNHPYKVFSDYKFKPVFINKKSEVPDYFENKNLYFVKILNGTHTRGW
jgi:ABC-type branched-subunit amino acid transport system substrate-binding protein